MQETQETWVWSLGQGRSSGVGNDNLLQYSHLENSMARKAWKGTVHSVTYAILVIYDQGRLSSPSKIWVMLYLFHYQASHNLWSHWNTAVELGLLVHALSRRTQEEIPGGGGEVKAFLMWKGRGLGGTVPTKEDGCKSMLLPPSPCSSRPAKMHSQTWEL